MRSAVLSLLLAAAVAGCGSAPTGNGPAEYQLEVRWLGDAPEAATQEAFTRAATRIRSVITGGLSPVNLPLDFNVEQCGANLTGFPDVPAQTVQGLIIYVLVEPIDGQGSVLGSAGPCLVRDEDRSKPALGIMRLDEADLAALAQSRLDALVLHEMLHVVGFGTIWTDNDLIDGMDTDDARFNGDAAGEACRSANGGVTTCATSVPVHSTDDVGSAYSHWREDTFGSELMTPFLNAGAAPLSAMSIRSLADLGYEVSSTSADAYAVEAGVVAALRDADSAPAIALPVPRAPRFKLRPDGSLLPLGDTDDRR